MKEPFVLESSKTGQYNMNLKLFGFITLKTVSVDVIDEVSVMPCGSAIGIHVKTNGLLVLGTGTVIGEDGLNYEPAYEVIQTGDYITGINGNVVENISELQEKLQEIKSNNATLSIRRNDLESQVSIPIIIGEDGIKKIGIWVREDTQGIGTLTFITDTGRFAALGHGITDSDTGLLLELQEGNIYNTEIIQIVKGSTGYPGEIMGMILESPAHLIGSIETNSNLGINGELKNQIDTSNYKYGCLDVGLRQEVKKGPATILCQLDKEIEEYEIEILEINRGSTDNKGLVIQITDERLIEKTGEIGRAHV